MTSSAIDRATTGATLPKYRWLVLIACWASFTLTSVDRSTWGPASLFVGESLAVPLASLGAFATAYYIGYVVSNAFGGFLSDAFGGRVVLTISLLGAGIAMICFGSVTSPTVGIAVQAVVGFFAGADYAAGVRLIAGWFRPDELGLALGLFVTATSIGTAVANLVVPTLISNSGWQASYHVFGAISIVVAIILFVTVRPGPLLDSVEEPRRNSSRKPDFGALARNRDLLLTCLAGLCAFWGLYGFVTWSNALMIKGHGMGSEITGVVVAIFAISAIISKPVIGFVSDRFFHGARKAPIIALFGAFSALLVLFGMLATPVAFLIAAPFLGLTAYGWSPLIISLVPRLVPTWVTGAASGIANAIWQIGSILAPMAVGAVFAATGSFQAAFLTLAAGPLVGMAVMFFVREHRPHRENIRISTEKEGS